MNRFEALIDGAEKNDVLLFYISGHTSLIKDTKGISPTSNMVSIMCPYDMNRDGHFILVPDLVDLVKKTKARQVVFIIDGG